MSRQKNSSRPITGQWIDLARERHSRDLKTGAARGLWFDRQAAERVRDFFTMFLVHSKGEFAGKPFVLTDWQYRDIIAPVFGWKRLPKGMNARQARAIPLERRVEAGVLRRFRTAYTEVARKNGKSTLLAGVGLYMLVADFEAGAEIYTAATKRDQAKIIHSEAVRMAQKSGQLKQFLRIFRDNISVPSTFSKFEPLGADADTMDGLNSHGNLIDEYHAHKDSKVFDVLTTGEGARRQPLTWIITTAGFNLESPCYQENKYARRVLAGELENDEYHAAIYTLDDGDEFENPSTWPKANPNLGISVKPEYLERQVRKALGSPIYRPTVMTKHFNVWINQRASFFSMQKWAACGQGAEPVVWRKEQIERLKGKNCYAGLDLGSVSDFTAFVLAFPMGDEWIVLPWFWLPESPTHEREQKLREHYRQWKDDGFLCYTDGDVVDYDRIRADIADIASQFWIEEVAVDRLFQGAQLCTQLQSDGHRIITFGQGFMSMAAPTKYLEELVLNGNIRHGNNPVLTWMASNTEVKTDPAGNMKPCKPERKNAYKIDGIVSTIMALARGMLVGESVYNSIKEDDHGNSTDD